MYEKLKKQTKSSKDVYEMKHKDKDQKTKRSYDKLYDKR